MNGCEEMDVECGRFCVKCGKDIGVDELALLETVDLRFSYVCDECSLKTYEKPDIGQEWQ